MAGLERAAAGLHRKKRFRMVATGFDCIAAYTDDRKTAQDMVAGEAVGPREKSFTCIALLLYHQARQRVQAILDINSYI